MLNGPRTVVRDPGRTNVSTVVKKVSLGLRDGSLFILTRKRIGHWARDCLEAGREGAREGGRDSGRGGRGGRGGGRGGFGRDRSPRRDGGRGNDRDRRYSFFPVNNQNVSAAVQCVRKIYLCTT